MTLAWIDPPNAFTARKQLLHDLDLRVVDPQGRVHHPNGLPGPDERNNVEKVVIHEPQPGAVYLLVVTAGELTEAPNQTYALVATGAGRAIVGQQEQDGEGGAAGSGSSSSSSSSSSDEEEQAGAAAAAAGPSSGGQGVMVAWEQVLHPCLHPCLLSQHDSDSGAERSRSSSSICRQLTLADDGQSGEGCIGACPEHAVAEARALLCDSSSSNSGGDGEGGDGASRRFFKVSARLVLRGLEADSFFDAAGAPALLADLTAALEAWLAPTDEALSGPDDEDSAVAPVAVHVVRVNGRAVAAPVVEEAEDGVLEHRSLRRQRRRLQLQRPAGASAIAPGAAPAAAAAAAAAVRFSSPRYGVAVDFEASAPLGLAHGRRLHAQMGASYGHLNDHLRLSPHPQLRTALAVDLQAQVASFRLLLPGHGPAGGATGAAAAGDGGGVVVIDERREEEVDLAAEAEREAEAAALAVRLSAMGAASGMWMWMWAMPRTVCV